MLLTKILGCLVLVASGVKGQSWALNFTYDHTNWYDDGVWTFMDLPDPTKGLVEYQNIANAQSQGLTKLIGNQVYMGVDNVTVIPSGSSTGRNSVWIQSKDSYEHYLLIADFEHMPGDECGTWPGFWSINNANDLGEIDIIEGTNTQTGDSMTLHTKGDCTFDNRVETGLENSDDCSQHNNTASGGCDTQGGMYGTDFNSVGGGVYATLWTSDGISMFFWPRNTIPEDVSNGNPDPSSWGMALAEFAGNADCNIDENFGPQMIVFDTTFCGANAGGKAWTTWSTCSANTGYGTCEEYVQAHPEAYDEAYWLVNYVKVYSEVTSSAGPPPPPATTSVAPFSFVAPTSTSSVMPQSTLISSTVPAKSSAAAKSVPSVPLSATSAEPSASSLINSISASKTTSPMAAPSTTVEISLGGSCGNGITCANSTFGNCCSASGYCGSNTDYCGAGCQVGFGTCDTPANVPTGHRISDYGDCGNGTTCQDSTFGNCCSQWGFCGSSDEYCGDGCQSAFGTCT